MLQSLMDMSSIEKKTSLKPYSFCTAYTTLPKVNILLKYLCQDIDKSTITANYLFCLDKRQRVSTYMQQVYIT